MRARAVISLAGVCGAALIACAPSSQPAPQRATAVSTGVVAPTPTVQTSVATTAPTTTAPTAAAPTSVPSAASPTPIPTAAATRTVLVEPSVPTPTDVPASRVLDVPLHRQEHALSCEAAALQMALAALGHTVSEGELLARLTRDPTPRRVAPDGSVVWGDPDVGFVGQWDGVFARDGYGVYEEPIAALARGEGFNNSVGVKDVDPGQLYEAVRAGDPVVVWMPYGGQIKGRGAWSTPAGKVVDYVVTEHAVVLAGVDDAGVTFADPYTARFQYMSFAGFESAMSELQNRAVIVSR